MEINKLGTLLDKFLILDRCSLPEAKLRWFYYFLFCYFKQEIQHQEQIGTDGKNLLIEKLSKKNGVNILGCGRKSMKFSMESYIYIYLRMTRF